MLTAQTKTTQETSTRTADHKFLVSLTPEAIPWKQFHGSLYLTGSRSQYSQETMIKQDLRMSFALSIETA
jgi:hypothetical protein